MHLCAHQMGLLGALIYESINMQMQQFLFVFSRVRPEFIVPRTKFSVSLRLLYTRRGRALRDFIGRGKSDYTSRGTSFVPLEPKEENIKTVLLIRTGFL